MASVVFLRGVNVGGHKTFRPSVLAREMAGFGLVNVGAAGTFIVTKPISQTKLRRELRRRLPFETEVMICSAKDILRLASSGAYDGEPSGSDIVRFVSIFAKRPGTLPLLPLSLPAGEDWLVRIVAIRGRFVFGMYRRNLRTIGFLGKLEKHLGGSITTRNWNTYSTLFEILRKRSKTGSPTPMTERWIQ